MLVTTDVGLISFDSVDPYLPPLAIHTTVRQVRLLSYQEAVLSSSHSEIQDALWSRPRHGVDN